MGTPIFERLAFQVGQKYLPKVGIAPEVSKYVPAIRNLLQGDIAGAVGGILDQLLGPMLGSSLEGNRLALAGGITLAEARQMFEETANTVFAKKNLWHLSASNVSKGATPNLNLFATEVSYTAHSITGEAVRVGSAFIDKLEGTERVEMRITTYDDSVGSIKRWFEDLRLQLAHRDGTFGLPIDYLVRFKVTHASILEGASNAYVNEYVMRPSTIETELSRRDDGLEEIAMVFVQFDPFTSL